MHRDHRREQLPYFEEAATYFLDSAFSHIDDAFFQDRRRQAFVEFIQGREIPEGWTLNEVPESIDEQLECSEHFFPIEDLDELIEAWSKTFDWAANDDIFFRKDHVLNSLQVLGHVINLYACVEAVLNQVIHEVNQSGAIPDVLCGSIDRSDILAKVYALRRDDVLNKTIQLGALRRLIKLRNKAVSL